MSIILRCLSGMSKILRCLSEMYNLLGVIRIVTSLSVDGDVFLMSVVSVFYRIFAEFHEFS